MCHSITPDVFYLIETRSVVYKRKKKINSDIDFNHIVPLPIETKTKIYDQGTFNWVY